MEWGVVDTVAKDGVACGVADKDRNLDVDQDCDSRRQETRDNKKSQRLGVDKGGWPLSCQTMQAGQPFTLVNYYSTVNQGDDDKTPVQSYVPQSSTDSFSKWSVNHWHEPEYNSM